MGSNQKTKAFNFTSGKEGFRPISKETDSRTSTSTPFGNLRQTGTNDDVSGSSLNQEVWNFLDGLKLSKYYQLFSDNAVDDMQTVLELNDEYLSELGLPLGHKLKILKKIKEIEQKREVEEEEKQPIYEPDNVLPPRTEQPLYEELPYTEPSPEKQTTNSWAIGDDSTTDFRMGEYDEEKMRKEFRAALSLWRGEEVIDEKDEYPNEQEWEGIVSQSVPAPKVTTDVQIGTDNKNSPQMVTTNIQHRGGDVTEAWEFKTNLCTEECNEMITCPHASPPKEAQNYGPISSDKIRIKPSVYKAPKKVSWYNWYKLGDDRDFYFDKTYSQSYFCNTQWIEVYLSKYLHLWSACENKFMKTDGVFAAGLWYWSETCYDQHTQLDN